jgi:hypothetical protein
MLDPDVKEALTVTEQLPEEQLEDFIALLPICNSTGLGEVTVTVKDPEYLNSNC